MRWNKRPEKDYYSWHRWYAWRPVSIGDKWVWLEYIERRYAGSWDGWYADYRFPR